MRTTTRAAAAALTLTLITGGALATATAANADELPTEPTTEVIETPAPEPVTEVQTEPAPEEETPAPIEEQAPAPEVIAPVEAEPVTEAQPLTIAVPDATKTISWALPAGIVPTGELGRDGYPQPIYTGQLGVCWLQVDTYRYQHEGDIRAVDALDDDGQLTYGEDWGLTTGWHFEQLDCRVKPEQPQPTVESEEYNQAQCADQIIVHTTVTTTTGTRYDDITNTYVPTEPVVTSTSSSRDATAEECPPVVPVTPDEPTVDTPAITTTLVAAPVVPVQRAAAPVLASTGAGDSTNALGLGAGLTLLLGVLALLSSRARRATR